VVYSEIAGFTENCGGQETKMCDCENVSCVSVIVEKGNNEGRASSPGLFFCGNSRRQEQASPFMSANKKLPLQNYDSLGNRERVSEREDPIVIHTLYFSLLYKFKVACKRSEHKSWF
jgi:hypothetical protein